MSDYDFSRLNPRDFEHLVQALVLAAISPGVTPFGDGPDGGREATYRGKTHYSSSGDLWDGYVVIQAKFKTRANSRSSGTWAVQQLGAELTAFADPDAKRTRPEYYLFVTNAVLTPTPETGSKDKAFAVLENASGGLGLKDWDIWDYDKLCRLLDTHEGVRRAYAGFITTGDVLSEVFRLVNGLRPDFSRVMSRFLQAELRADQFVRLEQAGYTSDQKTQLAQVFVDLRALLAPSEEPPRDERGDKPLPAGIVAELLELGSRVLRPSHLARQRGFQAKEPQAPLSNRCVLIGGPGQGKSTLGQLLCQIYRVSLLRTIPEERIAPEARELVNLFAEREQSSSLRVKGARRFPVRVVLDTYAAQLAAGQVNSVLSYIRAQISAATDMMCLIEDVREWLAHYPWLIVFDGLDEVPATRNRDDVMMSIGTFWSEVADVDADVLVVCTTRPQGYNDEFSPRYYVHRYLSPLSPRRALDYAERLADTRYSGDSTRRNIVLRRLNDAVTSPAVSRLMQSPLQVTIMATLVDRGGPPPQERWRLFQEYYDVIYRREVERDIPASAVLRQQKTAIDAIHHRAGLLLQAMGEEAEQTDARLTSDRFGALVRARLQEQGFEGEALASRISTIVEAALNRLVFLVGLQEDRIGFEVRSLQEYAAAEALMNGKDDEIRARLRRIAPLPYWRNVFLFAAGRCFAEREYLADTLISICNELNLKDEAPIPAALLEGSRLALDLLLDSSVRENPRAERILVTLALQLLEFPNSDLLSRLATVYQPHLRGVFEDAVRTRLEFPVSRHLGVWIILTNLASSGLPWALKLAEENWPAEVNAREAIVTSHRSAKNAWLLAKAAELVPYVEPLRVHSWISRRLAYADAEQAFEGIRKWTRLLGLSSGLQSRIRSILWGDEGHEIGYSSVVSFRAQPSPIIDEIRYYHAAVNSAGADVHHEWLQLIAAVMFLRDGTQRGLADALRWLADRWPSSTRVRWMVRRRLPWPMGECLHAADDADRLRALADAVEAGKLGSATTWANAEERWRKSGVSFSDIRATAARELALDMDIDRQGYPFAQASSSLDEPVSEEGLRMLNRLLLELPVGRLRAAVADLILTAYEDLGNEDGTSYEENPRSPVLWSPSELRMITEASTRTWLPVESLPGTRLDDPVPEEWVTYLDWVYSTYSFPPYDTSPFWEDNIDALTHAFVRDPTRLGLLRALAFSASRGIRFKIPGNLFEVSELPDKYQPDGFLLVLSQGTWRLDDVEGLVEHAIRLSAIRPYLIDECIGVLDEGGPDQTRNDVFVCFLRDRLLRSDPAALPPVLRALEERNQREKSRIIEPDVWHHLALPAYE
jgi:hypothetical protein